MSKLTGPEEFFEVFRPKQKQSEETYQRPQPPPAMIPTKPAPAQQVKLVETPQRPTRPLVNPAGPMMVTLKLSTLVSSGICAVLLIMLAYFIGVGGRPAVEDQVGALRQNDLLAGNDAGGGRTPPVRPVVGDVTTPNDTVHAVTALPGQLVLQVASFTPDNAQNRRFAADMVQSLNDKDELKTNRLYAGFTAVSNGLIVYVGPFEGETEPRAVSAATFFRNWTTGGRKPFADAYFRKLPQGR